MFEGFIRKAEGCKCFNCKQVKPNLGGEKQMVNIKEAFNKAAGASTSSGAAMTAEGLKPVGPDGSATMAAPPTPVTTSLGGISAVLAERGKNYGTFMNNAAYAQILKHTIRQMPQFNNLAFDQKEALDNICQKMARMLNGNPAYLDNWIDIVGYGQLVVDRMQREAAAAPAVATGAPGNK